MLKKFALQVGLLVIVICLGLYALANPAFLTNLSFINYNLFFPQNTTTNQQNLQPKKMINLKIVSAEGSEKARVKTEVVDTPELRSKGLGFRDSLDQDSGMLFIFDSLGQYKFWMKGMRFPLDMLWIKDDTVVDIIKNVPNPASNTPDNSLPVFAPTTQINRILEVNAGFVDSHGIVVGDKLVETPQN